MSELGIVDTNTTPVGGDTPAPAVPAIPGPSVTQPTTQVASPTPATGAPQVEPSWLKQRLEETRNSALRQSASQWQQKESAYQAQLEAVQRQLHALVGVTPPQNPEIDAIRNQFAQVFPDEWKLLQQLKERSGDLDRIFERTEDYESSLKHYWQAHSRQTVDSLFNKAQETFGAPLSDEAKRNLYTAFVGYVQSSPENEARYGQDPSIVEDFWRAFTSSFIDPVRRTASATVAGRVPQALPQDNSSGVLRTTPAPQMNNLDERGNAAWAMYNQLKK